MMEDFESFMMTHNKVYSNIEKNFRYENYKSSLIRIEKLNAMAKGTKFGINKFSDMSPEEFRASYLMPKTSAQDVAQSCLANGAQVDAPAPRDLPDAFDWRTTGMVTPIKDQAQCGSCWTFSTTGAIESAYAIKNKVMANLSLSEQAIVDCSKACSNVNGESVCNQGCDGGWPWAAVADVISWGGLPTESDYPYTATDGTCQVKGKTLLAKPTNYTCLSGPDQKGGPADETTAMATALMTYGPLSIALNADLFQDYESGILNPWFPSEQCDPTTLDHAVLLVGWGVESSAIWGKTQYWIVKNSWGTSWGESGYIRMGRGVGLCGINNAVMQINF
jgi:cathepsin F